MGKSITRKVEARKEEARERKAAIETERKDLVERGQEEKFWNEAEDPVPKSVEKRKLVAERRTEAAAKRAEAKKMAEQEQEEVEKSLKRMNKKSPKVTAAQIEKAKEDERHHLETCRQAEKSIWSRDMNEDEYKRLVTVENTNKDHMEVDARSVESALAQLFVMKSKP